MASIFFSYRKQGEDKPSSLRLADDLRAALGEDTVFRDEKGLKFGRFEDQLLRALHECKILVAVIGPTWIKRIEELHDESDWVRRELETALEQHIPIAPVLVDGATQPRASDLPSSIRELLDYQFITLHAKHWRSDVDELIGDIAEHLGIELRATNDAAEAPIGNLSGEWTSTEGENIVLEQNGDRIDLVTYAYGQPVGQGRGTLNGNQLQFLLRHVEFGEGTGSGTVTPDGRQIHGMVQYGIQRFAVSLTKR